MNSRSSSISNSGTINIHKRQLLILSIEQLIALVNELMKGIVFKDQSDYRSFSVKYGDVRQIDKWSKEKVVDFLLKFKPVVRSSEKQKPKPLVNINIQNPESEIVDEKNND
jgi:hypothetical protein